VVFPVRRCWPRPTWPVSGSPARQRTLRTLAAAVASGRLTWIPAPTPGDRSAGELPGIGPWTIGYILMRAAADPDAFPGADLGLRRALARLGAPAGHPARWRPWRAYAAMHLWTWPAEPEVARLTQPEVLAPAS
jgi:AraC family transcriptional regulator of adaptative response / DNA-3-methyladenine glycosylase II